MVKAFIKGRVYKSIHSPVWVKCLSNKPAGQPWRGVVVKCDGIYNVGYETNWVVGSTWAEDKEYKFKQLMDLYEKTKKG